MSSIFIYLMNYSHKKLKLKTAFTLLLRNCSSTSESTHGSNEKFFTLSNQKDIEERRKVLVQNYLSNSERLNPRLDSNQTTEKKYVLSMFPYPSGNLHMGHVRVYTYSDAIARFYHMKGHKVIHPMGWDAFGLPAENAAIEMGVNPAKWTKENIGVMKKQLKSLGCCFEWSRELSTCDPTYYKWTQSIFLKLFKAGLAYRQEAAVNWDPIDKTVLAHEQVDENGFSWRSGAKVEKRLLKQWFIKVTKFSKDLFEDLSDTSLEDWRDIELLQKHWIGDCNGYTVEMKIKDSNNEIIKNIPYLPVHMTEPELLDKVSFLGLRPGHILDQNVYIDSNKNNMKVLNLSAVDPFSNKLIPIIVSDNFEFIQDCDIYVGIPSINSKDDHICNICNIQNKSTSNMLEKNDKNSISQQRNFVVKRLKELGCGGYESSAKLKDWLISRQRYWGTPIPIIHCDNCGTVPVPEEDLPVKLPIVESFIEKGGHLQELKEWINCVCPQCSRKATREADTMDTFVDSSWYYLRYLDPLNDKEMVSKAIADELMPVDLYIGGKEHATMHLYYARFIFKFLKEQGLVQHKEPFKKLFVQGMVKNRSFRLKETGKYLRPEEIDFSESQPVEKFSNAPLIMEFEKMSKSKFNGINPQLILDKYGIDTLRLSVVSEVGPRFDRNWDEEALSRSFDIMTKMFNTTRNFVFYRQQESSPYKMTSTEEEEKLTAGLYESRNNHVRAVTYQLDQSFQFNSAIKELQQLIKSLRAVPLSLIFCEEYEKTLRDLILMMTPICPHLSSELWEKVNSVSTMNNINKDIPVFDQKWPKVDPSYPFHLVCKVNERTVCTIEVPSQEFLGMTQDMAVNMAKANNKLSKLLSDKVLNVNFLHRPNYKHLINFKTSTKKNKTLKKKLEPINE